MFNYLFSDYKTSFLLAPFFKTQLEEDQRELSIQEQCHETERKIFENYGVPHLLSYDVDCSIPDSEEEKKANIIHQQDYRVQKYKIKDNSYHEKAYIHTVSTEYKKEKPSIIFIHGYWSSSLSYIRCINHLEKYFNVYLIDLPGQALSSRVEFPYQTRQEMLNYFIDSLESWRQKMFKDQKVYLAGHSFGGFIAGHYAEKYQEHLEQLHLISPFGIYDDKDEDSFHSSVIYYTFKDHSEFSKKIIYKFFLKAWNLKITVSELYQSNPLGIGKYILKNYLKQTVDDQKPEFSLFSDYYDSIMKMPVSSERCMTTLLKFPQFTAFDPLEYKIQNLKIPVHFYFGDKDWMENKTANQLVQQKKVQGSYNVIDAGHNLCFDNPKHFSETLIRASGLFE